MDVIRVELNENEFRKSINQIKYLRVDNLWWESPNLLKLIGYSDKPIQDLIEIVANSKDYDKSWQAGYLLGKMKALEALPALIKISRDHNIPRIRSVAFWCIGRFHILPRDIFPFLIESLKKEKADIALVAILEALELMLYYHKISEDNLFSLIKILIKMSNNLQLLSDEDIDATLFSVFNQIEDKEFDDLVETIRNCNDYRIRLLVAKFFGKILGNKEVIIVLILVKQLDRSSKVRKQAYKSLLEIGEISSGKEDLLEIIKREDNIKIRKDAARIFQNVCENSKKVQKILIEAIKDPKNDLIKFDLVCLLAETGEREISFSIYWEMHSDGELTANQWVSFEEEFDPIADDNKLSDLEALQSGKTDKIIGILQNKTKVKERKEILNNFNDDLSIFENKNLTETLVNLLKNDSDFENRRIITQKFSYVKKIDVMDALCEALLNDSNSWVRFDAARALGTLEFVESIPSLVRAMQNDTQKIIRDEAINSLGQIGDESVIPFLFEIVKRDDDIFRTATYAISTINGDKGISALIKLLSIKDSNKLWEIIHVIELLGNKAEKIVPYLTEISEKSNDKRISAKAIYALGKIGGSDTIFFLQNILNSIEDDYIKFWIALSLSRINGVNSRAAKELEKLFLLGHLETDQITEYRLLARLWYLNRSEKDVGIDLDRAHKDDLDEIKHRISIGETKTFEYKEYMRFNKHKKEINNELKFKIVKTISSMMNTDGGQLIIGVKDSGEIGGLEIDYLTFPEKKKQNRDGFRLYLKDCINSYIGPQYNDFYNISFLKIESKDICIININPSDTPVFIKKEGKHIFSIRCEGGNQILDSKETQDYLKIHKKFITE